MEKNTDYNEDKRALYEAQNSALHPPQEVCKNAQDATYNNPSFHRIDELASDNNRTAWQIGGRLEKTLDELFGAEPPFDEAAKSVASPVPNNWGDRVSMQQEGVANALKKIHSLLDRL